MTQPEQSDTAGRCTCAQAHWVGLPNDHECPVHGIKAQIEANRERARRAAECGENPPARTVLMSQSNIDKTEQIEMRRAEEFVAICEARLQAVRGDLDRATDELRSAYRKLDQARGRDSRP